MCLERGEGAEGESQHHVLRHSLKRFSSLRCIFFILSTYNEKLRPSQTWEARWYGLVQENYNRMRLNGELGADQGG